MNVRGLDGEDQKIPDPNDRSDNQYQDPFLASEEDPTPDPFAPSEVPAEEQEPVDIAGEQVEQGLVHEPDDEEEEFDDDDEFEDDEFDDDEDSED